MNSLVFSRTKLRPSFFQQGRRVDTIIYTTADTYLVVLNENEVENGTERKDSTVKPVYSRQLRFLKKVSAISRCPLYRVLDYFGKKDRNLDGGFFSYNATKQHK